MDEDLSLPMANRSCRRGQERITFNVVSCSVASPEGRCFKFFTWSVEHIGDKFYHPSSEVVGPGATYILCCLENT